ncbi:MAG TPA: hypothetical protein VFE18_01785 [Phenylobacterium sp.]|jgi:hypothetical protein|uniref:hypothetical protein n=1 Tax=Phenylobacterium sp. TaxID=1871053 RepID=UPI002D537FE9|nr:hypothetical protein [Phenylobacterium sp.]HZZ66879.1 hypothetical protein [Phenylobacterium sp.]
MSVEFTPPAPAPALISRTEIRAGAPAAYLMLTAAGAADWTSDPRLATAFPSMREAARMALRLPANLRAYGLPLSGEVSLH